MNGWRNSVKCSKAPAERPKHRTVKFWLANWCWEHKLDFITEVSFKSSQRADFLIIKWGLIIEVLDSEKLTGSKKNYPFKTIKIQTTLQQYDITDMLEDLHTSNGKLADYYIKKYN